MATFKIKRGTSAGVSLLQYELGLMDDKYLIIGNALSQRKDLWVGSADFSTEATHAVSADSATSTTGNAATATFASNAGLLDNIDSTQFLRSDVSDTFTSGTLTIAAGTTLKLDGTFVGNVPTASLAYQLTDDNQTGSFGANDFLKLAGVNNQTITGTGTHFSSGLKVSGTLDATAAKALYADIAEYYETDKTYTPGDILMFGSETESTLSDGSMPLMGVCSTAPAYLMNTQIEATHFAPIALKGRIPVNITGAAKRGDFIIVDLNNPGKGIVVDSVSDIDKDRLFVGICVVAGTDICEVKV